MIKDTDDLDDCIMEIFGETEELDNTELSIHDNYTDVHDVVI